MERERFAKEEVVIEADTLRGTGVWKAERREGDPKHGRHSINEMRANEPYGGLCGEHRGGKGGCFRGSDGGRLLTTSAVGWPLKQIFSP